LFNNNTLRCNIHRYFNLETAVRKNSRLPNLQNLGILLRILLIVNFLGVLAVVLLSNKVADILPLLAELSMVIQPILLASILALYLLYPLLNKLKYWLGVAVILLLTMGISAMIVMLFTRYFTFDAVAIPYRIIMLAGFTTTIVLYYFSLLQRAYSPAIAEARLQALQARIRPHFLFNSINAVLSLIRSQPKRAETALEDMADLFRVLMAENRELVPLEKEIALCKQYLSIESLRMEDRLKLNWQIEGMPPDALIPPLILQPLIENAVYHGIEPIPEGGEILIAIESKLNELRIKISNPYLAKSNEHIGNKMALKNIKERLALHFDLEASIRHRKTNNQYTVTIRVPYETT
jgi:two-component system, LytTR family, sensor histidine kinase AlgZ